MLLRLAVLGLAVFAGLMGWVAYRAAHLPAPLPTDVIIVLGAQVKADGTLSLSLARRLAAALEAYQARPQLIITCGAQGVDEPMPEGEAMRDWLVARGVPAQAIVPETASFNTRENLLHAREIMQARGLTRALVVTSDYHVPRALALCTQLGIPSSGVGSPSEPAYWVKNHAREALSWIKFWVEGLTWRE